jgi:hypothetical protein
MYDEVTKPLTARECLKEVPFCPVTLTVALTAARVTCASVWAMRRPGSLSAAKLCASAGLSS